MGKSAHKIQELRELLGQLTGTMKKEFFPSPNVPLGIPRGAIVEVTGTLKTEWLIQFLVQNPLETYWVEREQTVFPTALHQRGVDLDKVSFGSMAEPYAALRRVIQSQLFEVVIAPSVFEENRILKSLQLLTEKSNCVLFLVAKTTKPAWPIAVQIAINTKDPQGQLVVEVSKHKFAGVS